MQSGHQERNRKIRISGLEYATRRLTPKQIEKLDSIGMKWGQHSAAWNKSYEEAKEYYESYGDLDIPVAYVTKTGLRLGRWIRRQRDAYKNETLNA